MKSKLRDYIHAVNDVIIVLFGIGFVALFWVIEAMVDTFASHRGKAVTQEVASPSQRRTSSRGRLSPLVHFGRSGRLFETKEVEIGGEIATTGELDRVFPEY